MPSAATRHGSLRRFSTPAIELIALVVLNAVVWGGTIRYEFVFDDLVNVLGNRWIRDWHLLPAAFTRHAAGFDPAFNTSFYRPLMHVFYSIAYWLSGTKPWAFHLLNVVLHISAVVCVYLLTRGLMRRWDDPTKRTRLPWIAALVFSLHPIHAEAVAWVAAISDLSYTFFGLLAWLTYLRAFERRRWAVLAALFLLASMLAKETGATVFLLLLVFEGVEAYRGRQWQWRAAGVRLLPAALAVMVYATLRFSALGSLAPSAQQHPQGTFELLCGAFALFARYMLALVAPIGLSVMRVVPSPQGFADAATLGGMLLAGALLIVVVRLRRQPLVVLAAAVAVLPIVPVLYAPAIESGNSVFGERYLYLSVLGIGWCLGLALQECRARFAWGARASERLLVLLALASSAASLRQAHVWASPLSLWTDAAAKSPQSPAAHEGLCHALYGVARFPEALAACDKAITLDPSRVEARINKSLTLIALGDAATAARELETALSMKPNSPEAHTTHGLALMMLKQPAAAMAAYRRALEIDPEFAEAHNDLGVALAREGRLAEALVHFQEAVRLAPDDREYRANLQASTPR